MSDFGLLDAGLFDSGSSSDLLGNHSFLEETVHVSTSSQKMINLNRSGSGGQARMMVAKDLLGMTLEDCGLLKESEKTWENDTDSFLDSILTGSEVNDLLAPPLSDNTDLERPFSDTSSDSGNYDLNPGCTLSPRSDHTDIDMTALSPDENNGKQVDLVEFITTDGNSDEDEEQNLKQVVSPMTNSPPEPLKTIRIVNPTQFSSSIQTGTTTIVLPVMNIRHAKQIASVRTATTTSPPPPSKRRRTSASSSDSGLDENNTTTTTTQIITTGGTTTNSSNNNNKYPPLILNDEEKRLCEREGVKLPSHYPLSREEEKNLKRIRRKIRNKVSAQDSRKRKKEYVDAMEDRVRKCTEQNEELNKKIQLLETHNKTLAGQLKRLHQIIVNGGLKNPSQASTAMMVLLLSTALFLMPGMKDQQGSSSSSNSAESKCDLDVISQAIKMPPMPGRSRSLLQFAATSIKQEFSPIDTAPGAAANGKNNMENAKQNVDKMMTSMVLNADSLLVPTTDDKAAVKVVSDHDYFYSSSANGGGGGKNRIKPLVEAGAGLHGGKRANVSYIEEDAPPQGYGPGKVTARNMDEGLVERRVNVTGGRKGSMRTVVLHVPKDIK